jgi:AbiV family abortive infection protein
LRYDKSLIYKGKQYRAKYGVNMDLQIWHAIYATAHNNAANLLGEAEILSGHERYARAYFLAFTGLEELAKSQLAADVYTGFITEEEFRLCFRDHKRKIGRMAWASEDAKKYLDPDTERHVEVKDPEVAVRMKALYVDIQAKEILSPDKTVSKEDSESIIHTLRVAIDRITEVEFLQGRIGTKGFMK